MARLAKHFDPPSLLVITITAGLFLVPLLVKGFTHDMLLEAGVLMISIKLILMAYKEQRRNAVDPDGDQEGAVHA